MVDESEEMREREREREVIYMGFGKLGFSGFSGWDCKCVARIVVPQNASTVRSWAMWIWVREAEGILIQKMKG